MWINTGNKIKLGTIIVVTSGFEPLQIEPKSIILPLYYVTK